LARKRKGAFNLRKVPEEEKERTKTKTEKRTLMNVRNPSKKLYS